MPCSELLLHLSNEKLWFWIQAIFLTTRNYLQLLYMHICTTSAQPYCVWMLSHKQSYFIISFFVFHWDYEELIYGEKYLPTEMSHDTQINKHLVIQFSLWFPTNNRKKIQSQKKEIGRMAHWIVWRALTLRNRCDIEQFWTAPSMIFHFFPLKLLEFLSSLLPLQKKVPLLHFFLKKKTTTTMNKKKLTIFSSCYELNIKFYFFSDNGTMSNFSRACIGKFMCKLCCRANWMKKINGLRWKV